jgi:hypothetical protein
MMAEGQSRQELVAGERKTFRKKPLDGTNRLWQDSGNAMGL